MKIIILITVVESSLLMLWLAYSFYRRKSSLRIAVRQPGFTTDHSELARGHKVRRIGQL